MMHKTTAADVLERLQTLIGVANDSQLAKVLGVNRQTLGSWRVRNSVPYELCVKQAIDRSASLDWILTGEGQMLHGETIGSMSTETTDEETVLAAMRSLNSDEQIAVRVTAQSYQRLRAVEMAVKEIAAQVAAFKHVP